MKKHQLLLNFFKLYVHDNDKHVVFIQSWVLVLEVNSLNQINTSSSIKRQIIVSQS